LIALLLILILSPAITSIMINLRNWLEKPWIRTPDRAPKLPS
jgi:hypothetical protein